MGVKGKFLLFCFWMGGSWSQTGVRGAAHPGAAPTPCQPLGAADPVLVSFAGMSHESKSPSLGMLSTATRTTATVSPLTPSPLNGSIVPNGSPAASSTLSVQAAPSSSFAAALRKLAKQAEEPRGTYGAGWDGNGGETTLGLPQDAAPPLLRPRGTACAPSCRMVFSH